MTRLAGRMAWVLLGASLVLKVVAVVLVVGMREAHRPPDGLAFLIWTPGVIAFGVVGALVAARHPRNAVGWIFLGVGVAEPVFMVAEQYARLGLLVAPGSLPAAGLVGTFGAVLSGGVLVAVLLTALLFPTGQLPSRRWRPVLILVGAWALLLVLSTLFAAGPISDVIDVANPTAAPGPIGEVARQVRLVVDSVGAFLVLLTAPALVVRWRGSHGAERAQLAWLVYAVAVLVVAVTVIVPIWDLELLGPITPTVDLALSAILVAAVGGIPAAAGMAILRHRLYDIDVVIRRTVVYAGVVGVLSVAYVGLVLGSQAILSGATGSETLPVALSTLATAALFGPVRRRVRRAVDRRFYRSRYDAQRTVETFSARLRDEVELHAVGSALVQTVGGSVQPVSAGVWLRGRPS